MGLLLLCLSRDHHSLKSTYEVLTHSSRLNPERRRVLPAGLTSGMKCHEACCNVWAASPGRGLRYWFCLYIQQAQNQEFASLIP